MTMVISDHIAPPVDNGNPVREAAQNMMTLLRANGEDPSNAPRDVEAALAPLVSLRGELFETSIVRPAKNPGHQMSILYFDPGLMLQIVGAPGGFRLPIHNHSAWNILYICDGEMQFRWYKRLDDRSVEGHATLEIAEDRRLHSGDAGVVGRPPHDIHELEVTTDYMWMVVATPEPEVRTREIYDYEKGTYELKSLAPLTPRLWQGSTATAPVNA